MFMKKFRKLYIKTLTVQRNPLVISAGQDSALPLQGPRVRSLVGEPGSCIPCCCVSHSVVSNSLQPHGL